MLPVHKPTQKEFDKALNDAIDGVICTDIGFSDPVLDALELIAANSPTVIPALTEAAKTAWLLSK